MTDRFSPSLPFDGKVQASLVHRVADVARAPLEILAAFVRAAVRAPAIVIWRFDYRALRLGLADDPPHAAAHS